MGVLAKLDAALLSVPLMLSSILLRALDAIQRQPRRRSRGAARRGAPPPSAPAPREPATAPNNGPPDVKAMRRALAVLLDAHPGSRDVFRYLAHLERRLAKAGLKTLDEMPLDRLRRALAQLEAIVANWSAPHLAELRSRMAVAVSTRSGAGALWEPQPTLSKAYAPRRMPMLAGGARRDAPTPTEFQGSRQVEVDDDIGISRFEAAVGAWDLSQRQALAALAGPASRQ